MANGEVRMVEIPMEVLAEGIEARNTLKIIKELIETGNAYCSSEIKAILGIPVDYKEGA